MKKPQTLISIIFTHIRNMASKVTPFILLKKYKHKRYINKLTYALKELSSPDKWIDEYVRESKKDAVHWLLQHYIGENSFYKTSPKQRIMDVLGMSVKDFTPKDKVYIQVLNYWCTYKRIEGF